MADKRFVWIWRERVDHRKPKVPNREVVRASGGRLGQEQAVLAIDSQAFFTLINAAYKVVLASVSTVDAQELTELITDSRRLRAPTAMVEESDAQ